MKQKIVVVGDPLLGPFTFHGPFEDGELADQWRSIHAPNQRTYVFDLEPLHGPNRTHKGPAEFLLNHINHKN